MTQRDTTTPTTFSPADAPGRIGGEFIAQPDGSVEPTAVESERRAAAEALDEKCKAAGVTDPSSLPPDAEE